MKQGKERREKKEMKKRQTSRENNMVIITFCVDWNVLAGSARQQKESGGSWDQATPVPAAPAHSAKFQSRFRFKFGEFDR